MADLTRFRRAVYPVVRYVDPHPNHTHRIVRASCDLHLGIRLISIPEQVGVVVVGWISHHVGDDPIPEWEWVVLTAARNRCVIDDLALPVIHPQDRCLLRDNDLDRAGMIRRSWFGAQHVGDADVLSLGELCARVQALEESRGRVESPVEFFQHGCVVKACQLRLLRRVFWNRFVERPGDVFRRDRVRHDWYNTTGTERLKQGLAAPGAGSKPTRGLERGQGFAAVLSALPVDLTRREVGPIEEDLQVELCEPDWAS